MNICKVMILDTRPDRIHSRIPAHISIPVPVPAGSGSVVPNGSAGSVVPAGSAWSQLQTLSHGSGSGDIGGSVTGTTNFYSLGFLMSMGSFLIALDFVEMGRP